MLHQTRGLIAQFNAAVEIYSRPPLLLWWPSGCFWTENWQ